MLKNPSEIHKKRCDEDAIYNMFFFPEYNNLLNDFLDCCIKVLEKKYGSALEKSKRVKRMFRLLRETPEDVDIIRFVILFLIVWETDIRNALLQQISQKEHFRACVSRFSKFVDQTIQFSYNKHNIIEIVTEFEKAARLEYVMGPLTTNSNSSL